MQNSLEQYANQLQHEHSAAPGRVALAAINDVTYQYGPHDLASLAQQILHRLGCATIIVAEPSYPFSQLLIDRSPGSCQSLKPRDSESKAFLHDIPIIRLSAKQTETTQQVCEALAQHKGCFLDGVGIISKGTLTVEQAYINWASLYHAATIKYFEDLLLIGAQSQHELSIVKDYFHNLHELSDAMSAFSCQSPITDQGLLEELVVTGKKTVELGLVDSFFGNISYALNGSLSISQTAARLDQLEKQVDSFSLDGKSTIGITASSELPAHKAIIEATGVRCILHGHPRFSVIMSYFAVKGAYGEGIDEIEGVPVVDGEGGVGGMAVSVSNALKLTGQPAVIVRGHGVFSIGRLGFDQALSSMIKVELFCRQLCRQRIQGINPLSW